MVVRRGEKGAGCGLVGRTISGTAALLHFSRIQTHRLNERLDDLLVGIFEEVPKLFELRKACSY